MAEDMSLRELRALVAELRVVAESLRVATALAGESSRRRAVDVASEAGGADEESGERVHVTRRGGEGVLA